jgi:hypothetical protein
MENDVYIHADRRFWALYAVASSAVAAFFAAIGLDLIWLGLIVVAAFAAYRCPQRDGRFGWVKA